MLPALEEVAHRVGLLLALRTQVSVRQPDTVSVVEHPRAEARPQLGKGGPVVSGELLLFRADVRRRGEKKPVGTLAGGESADGGRVDVPNNASVLGVGGDVILEVLLDVAGEPGLKGWLAMVRPGARRHRDVGMGRMGGTK